MAGDYGVGEQFEKLSSGHSYEVCPVTKLFDPSGSLASGRVSNADAPASMVSLLIRQEDSDIVFPPISALSIF
jgi:hypothetical protein